MSNFEIDDVQLREKKLNPKERGLGRGLGALFGDEEEVALTQDFSEKKTSDVSRKIIGIEKLYPCPDQPRRFFDEKALKELADSIVEYGLLQPILVRPGKGQEGLYEIVAGERRWRASQKAQLHEVPVIIKELDDAAAFQIALVENLQRQDLNSIEEAQGYQRLIDEFGHSPESVGEVLGKSRSHVSNMVRLLQLPQSVQTMVVKDQLTAGHARALLASEEPALLAQEVIAKKLSVRETEKLVAQSAGREITHRQGSQKKPGFSAKDADTLALEKEVSNQIGMNVTIDMADSHKGKMTISFKSLDQLDDVLQRLAQTPKY
ncbi:MAG: ParB/RepB/Spo0J family partition protein [Alphaproteobacteria bacterium]|nr:ParB/RepB/Spo0J family partition protein [Alphaproteobacteria bacterium]